MFDKTILINKVINALQDNGYETFVTHGSFDIVARQDRLILIKTLMNIDSLEESHAMDLKAVSYFLSAHPFIVSIKNNREHLNDETVYSRFDVPVVTPKLMRVMLEDDELVVSHSSKGRHTQEINTFTLKEKRKELGYTLQVLAKQIGISKKAMYEIEKKRVNPQRENAHALERLLGTELALPYEMKFEEPTYIRPKTVFQKIVSREFARLGIDNSTVRSAPFEIIGRESFSIITNLSTTPSEIKKEIEEVRGLANVFSSKTVLISKRYVRTCVEGIPVVSEQELSELQSSKELSEIIDERTY
ncbi:MAG: helix-turn-helix domain-containing protein [Candidatus Aenigmarchaeota archaeon]|nr:helix-turn-helix domain-containing protein [Candidatus Aenigmarchaeota archaeon]